MLKRCRANGSLVLVIALLAALAACKSPEQIQAEQDEADDQRCARLGVPVAPGDPGYIQCRMWAAQMRAQEQDERRQNWLLALQAFGAMQQQQAPLYQAPYQVPAPYQAPVYGDGPPLQPQWIIPPPAPQTTWCRPVGRWMSCTTQ